MIADAREVREEQPQTIDILIVCSEDERREEVRVGEEEEEEADDGVDEVDSDDDSEDVSM